MKNTIYVYSLFTIEIPTSLFNCVRYIKTNMNVWGGGEWMNVALLLSKTEYSSERVD